MKALLFLLVIILLTLKCHSQYFLGSQSSWVPKVYIVPQEPVAKPIPLFDSIKKIVFADPYPVVYFFQQFTYDENYNITGYAADELALGEPTGIDIKYSFEYNERNQLTAISSWIHNGFDWQLYGTWPYSYDNDGYLTASGNTVYDWDSVHNLISQISFSGSDTIASYFWTYNSNGDTLTEQFRERGDSTFMHDQKLTTWIYDNENKLIHLYVNTWYGAWAVDSTTYEYDDQDRIESTHRNEQNEFDIYRYYYYDQNGDLDSIYEDVYLYDVYRWSNYELFDYDEMDRLIFWLKNSEQFITWHYDESGNFLGLRQYWYDHSNMQWGGLSDRITHHYDTNGILVSTVDTFGESIDTTHYYFKSYVALGAPESINEQSHLTVFPNPASDYVTFSLDNAINATITIFDLHGRQIEEIRTTGKTNIWNTSHLNPGIYLYRYKTSGTSSTGKIVIK